MCKSGVVKLSTSKQVSIHFSLLLTVDAMGLGVSSSCLNFPTVVDCNLEL